MKLFLLPALLASTSIAAELTIKTGPLESSLSIDTSFIPTEVETFQVSPKQWTSFVVKELVDHGTEVQAGDPLVTFEAEDYQKKLLESKESAKSRQIALAKAERELADLKISTPRTLEGLKLTHDRAKEALDDFTESGRALNEEDARERLEGSKRSLSYYEEELKQLLKMYEEDGITEETEEIILKRQRASVKSARFALKRAEKRSAWALNKEIPRQAVDLKRAFDDALLAYETGKVNLPRALEEKTLALAKTKRDHAEADQKLAELEADAKFLSIVAPANGIIYHGEINKHSWALGNSDKFMKEKGAIPADTVFMSLIPEGRTLSLHGTIGQADRLNLSSDASGSAEVDGLKNTTFPTAITTLSNAPDGEGKFRVAMSVELAADSPIVTGMKAKVKLITFRKEDAMSVPSSAITTKDEVSTVKLKMADGKDEIREVKLGRVVGDKTEILEGLEADQVILVPDPPKK